MIKNIEKESMDSYQRKIMHRRAQKLQVPANYQISL